MIKSTETPPLGEPPGKTTLRCNAVCGLQRLKHDVYGCLV